MRERERGRESLEVYMHVQYKYIEVFLSFGMKININIIHDHS